MEEATVKLQNKRNAMQLQSVEWSMYRAKSIGVCSGLSLFENSL